MMIKYTYRSIVRSRSIKQFMNKINIYNIDVLHLFSFTTLYQIHFLITIHI